MTKTQRNGRCHQKSTVVEPDAHISWQNMSIVHPPLYLSVPVSVLIGAHDHEESLNGEVEFVHLLHETLGFSLERIRKRKAVIRTRRNDLIIP